MMYKYYVYQGNNSRLFLRPLLEKRGNWVEVSEQEASELKLNFIWKPTILSVRAYSQLDQIHRQNFGPMIHNHLENNRAITTKPGLIRSLRQFYSTNEQAGAAGYNVHDTIATSFIITAQVEDSEYRQFQGRYHEIQNLTSFKERTPIKHCEKNMWLIKPAHLNQGKGIEICRNLKEIKSILKSKQMHSIWLIQKYIERPLLFKGRKFDIRVWAVGTAKFEFFYYRHGYLRTSSSEYDTQGKDNFIHLTNNCLQKYGENYGMHEEGNTLGFQAFQEYLDETFPQLHINFWEHILPRIKDLMIDSYLSAKKEMHSGKRKLVFELFGFDFLIDEDFRVWLIEVNTNPYLGVPNEYIEVLLPKMLDDLLAITVDAHIPPKNPRTRTENDYELLYCETGSTFSPEGNPVNQRQSYSVPIYPFSELAQSPMCKAIPQKSEPEEAAIEQQQVQQQSAKIVARDTLNTIKDLLDSAYVKDIVDFATVTSRLMSQLNNWELMSEEQINTSLQALNLLASSVGLGALIAYSHIQSLMNLCISENVPKNIQVGALNSLAVGCQDTTFRKEMIKIGLCENLINLVYNTNIDESATEAALKAIFVISTHSTKKVYIPGKTRDHNWIRTKIICEGVLMCLYKLKNEYDESKSEMIDKHLKAEFSLPDWDLQISVLETLLGEEKKIENPLSSPKGTKKRSSIAELQSLSELVKFPPSLSDPKFLQQSLSEIKDYCNERREEYNRVVESEKRKKQIELEEKMKQKELEDRINEEKKLKVEEYAIKRFEEIRRQKTVESKKVKEKEKDEKFDQTKRALLLEKAQRLEEAKRNEKMKQKQKVEDLKREEAERRKELEEKRKKALEEWFKVKAEQEREKKMQLKQKLEDELLRKNLEFHARKEEIIKQSEEIKKRNEAKESNKENKIKIESGLEIIEENSVSMIEDSNKNKSIKQISTGSNITPTMKDFRIKTIKKRPVMDKFLYKVYCSIPKPLRRDHGRSQSKKEIYRGDRSDSTDQRKQAFEQSSDIENFNKTELIKIHEEYISSPR